MAINYPILSKYRLIARLGRGGMAEVYLAMAADRSGFNKLQVLKMSRPDIGEQVPDWLEMFEAEARLAARLNHPNIVQTHGFGAEEGHHFIAMEYLDGQSSSRVQRRGWSSPAEGFPLEMHLFVLCEVLEGLDYAHGLNDYDGTPLNIVHRDISPQNIVITYAGQTKIVDFGIAKTFDSTKTRAGVIKGKLAYIAPEQVLNENVDHRADLFSVGVMLWSAIARSDMHRGASAREIEQRLLRGELPKIREAVPQIPEPLERILTRALAVQPAERYPNARAFRNDLVGFLEAFRKVSAREVGERVARLFAKERLEIDSVICKVMTQVKREEAERPLSRTPKLPDVARLTLPPKLPEIGSSNSSLAVRESITRRVPKAPASNSAPPIQVALNAPTRVARRGRWIPVVIGMVMVGGALAVALHTHRDHEQASIGPAIPLAERISSAVRVNVWTYPSGAQLMLDGKPLGTSPYAGERQRDAAAHTLEISAPGFASQRVQIRFEEDADLEYRLAASSAAAGARVSSQKRSRARRAPASAAPVVERDVLPVPEASRVSRALVFDIADPWAPE